MQLKTKNLKESFWSEKGYQIPQYDIETIKENTKNNPTWVHFGAGNIFRVFPAKMQHDLLNKGLANTGIIVCENFDEEIISKVYDEYDNLTIGVSLKVDGSIDKTIIASITEGLIGSQSIDRLTEIFTHPGFQMASFTITEKGYVVTNAEGNFLPFIQPDIDSGPDGAKTLMPLLTRLLYYRYLKGAMPVTMVSMDNCSHNGEKLYNAVSTIAKAWADLGKVESGFVDYICDPTKVAFPFSMIDKITPRPADAVKDILINDGVENCEPVITSKNTYTASFVNAEESGYLVIEDIFTNGRPALENAGVIFTDRATVDQVEKMKVCTCLNPLHTVLAVFGCMLGYDSISAEMEDTELVQLVKKIGYTEGLPVVVDPKIISPKEFIDECINVRFPNKFMPDTPQRIACDTSQKIPVRFGETLKALLAKGEDVATLTYIPLFFAGYLKYLTGVGENGVSFEQSPDPMLESLTTLMKGVDVTSVHQHVQPILSNPTIFGMDLYQVGLGEKVEAYFTEMLQNGIRVTLKKYL